MKSNSPLRKHEFEDHLQSVHNRSSISVYLKEIVYGGGDGIVTTFAVVAGFAGAGTSIPQTGLPVIIVLIFGLANLFGDAVSMALGNFLSLRSEREQYETQKKIEQKDLSDNKEFGIRESIYLLKKRGFTQVQAEDLTKVMSQNKKYWLRFMMENELEMSYDERMNPVLNAGATFCSFVLFGLIPLIPYIFFSGINNSFLYSIAFTLIALVLLGFLRWKISKGKLLKDMGEVLLIGTAASSVAYFVGTLF